jgi:hypothetical protein
MKLRIMRAVIIGDKKIAIELHRIIAESSALGARTVKVSKEPTYKFNVCELDFTDFVENDDASEAHYSQLLMSHLSPAFNLLDEQPIIYDRRGDYIPQVETKYSAETLAMMRAYDLHCLVQASPTQPMPTKTNEDWFCSRKVLQIPKRTMVSGPRQVAPLTDGISRFKSKILLNIISNQQHENYYPVSEYG